MHRLNAKAYAIIFILSVILSMTGCTDEALLDDRIQPTEGYAPTNGDDDKTAKDAIAGIPDYTRTFGGICPA